MFVRKFHARSYCRIWHIEKKSKENSSALWKKEGKWFVWIISLDRMQSSWSWQSIGNICLWEWSRAGSSEVRSRMKSLKLSSTKFSCRELMCHRRNKLLYFLTSRIFLPYCKWRLLFHFPDPQIWIFTQKLY